MRNCTNTTVGIIGMDGRYGRWLADKFRSCGYLVCGSDPKTPTGLTNAETVLKSDIVFFSTPTSALPDVAAELIPLSDPSQLWIDLTEVKTKSIPLLLQSRSEVMGLHPLVAPTADSWKGQNVILCVGRCSHWRGWLNLFLGMMGVLPDDVLVVDPEEHDRMMAYVQALPHAMLLVVTRVLRDASMHPQHFASISTPMFRALMACAARMFSLPLSNYVDIQTLNRDHTLPVLEGVLTAAASLRNRIASGDAFGLAEDMKELQAFLGMRYVTDGALYFNNVLMTKPLVDSNPDDEVSNRDVLHPDVQPAA